MLAVCQPYCGECWLCARHIVENVGCVPAILWRMLAVCPPFCGECWLILWRMLAVCPPYCWECWLCARHFVENVGSVPAILWRMLALCPPYCGECWLCARHIVENFGSVPTILWRMLAVGPPYCGECWLCARHMCNLNPSLTKVNVKRGSLPLRWLAEWAYYWSVHVCLVRFFELTSNYLDWQQSLSVQALPHSPHPYIGTRYISFCYICMHGRACVGVLW